MSPDQTKATAFAALLIISLVISSGFVIVRGGPLAVAAHARVCVCVCVCVGGGGELLGCVCMKAVCVWGGEGCRWCWCCARSGHRCTPGGPCQLVGLLHALHSTRPHGRAALGPGCASSPACC
jgi:hypothetical protein